MSLESVAKILFRIMPDYFLDLIQDLGLKELDRRGLIIWEDGLKKLEIYLNSDNPICQEYLKNFGSTPTQLNDRERLFLIASIASRLYVNDTKMIGDDLVKFASNLKYREDLDQQTATKLIQFLAQETE